MERRHRDRDGEREEGEGLGEKEGALTDSVQWAWCYFYVIPGFKRQMLED